MPLAPRPTHSAGLLRCTVRLSKTLRTGTHAETVSVELSVAAFLNNVALNPPLQTPGLEQFRYTLGSSSRSCNSLEAPTAHAVRPKGLLRSPTHQRAAPLAMCPQQSGAQGLPGCLPAPTKVCLLMDGSTLSWRCHNCDAGPVHIAHKHGGAISGDPLHAGYASKGLSQQMSCLLHWLRGRHEGANRVQYYCGCHAMT